MAKPAPDLHIPSANSIVQVSIIDTTTHIGGIPNGLFMVPPIPGYEYLNCPSYSFLIEHSSGRKILFDLGVRKDWDNLAPKVFNRLKESDWDIRVPKDVREILEEEGIDPGTVDGIVWRFDDPVSHSMIVFRISYGDQYKADIIPVIFILIILAILRDSRKKPI